MASHNTQYQVDLSNCDKEPIHQIGYVQPHGFFCALLPDSNSICALSENFSALFEADAASLIGRPVDAVFESAAAEKIITAIGPKGTPIPFEIELNSQIYWANPYWTGGVLAIDFEPAGSDEPVDLAVLKATAAMKQLRLVDDRASLIEEFVHLVREVLDFDRTMVYQFDNEFNGTVIAEICSPVLDHSFLGLTFPHTDIPAQARALFSRNRVRTIRRVVYDAVKILPDTNPRTNLAFDLSDSTIRSVSPIHIEYLKNMDVSASLTISLLIGHELWGLIACHHYQGEKYVPPRVRNACLMMCESFSLSLSEIEAKRRSASLAARLRQVNELYTYNIDHGNADLDDLFASMADEVMQILEADGVLVQFEDSCMEFGLRPADIDLKRVCRLAKNLAKQNIHGTLATDYLKTLGMDSVPQCAGILFQQLPADQGWLLAIRAEQAQAVSWAGDPNNKVIVDPDTRHLHPRRSFELFQQTRKGRSMPWLPEITDIAPDLVNTLFNIAIMTARRVEQDRRLGLQRQIAKVKQHAKQELAEKSKEKRLLSERLALATLAGNIGVWEWNIVSGEVEWDERMFRLYGLEPEAVKPSYDMWRAMIHPEDVEGVEEGLQEALTHLDQFHHGFRVIYAADNGIRHIYAHGLLERDEHGQPRNMVGVNWDVTEQKEFEFKLEKLIEQLGASNAELERFAYVASHDLKEPLRMITSFTKLFAERYEDQLDEKGKEYMRYSVEGAMRMQQLIDDLLAYARLNDDGKEQVLTDVERVLDEIKQDLKSLLKMENAQISNDSMPHVICHRMRFKRLLQNLILNAVKYHKPGIPPEVYISAKLGNDEWVFAVKDNGIGIDPKYQQQIFEPFKRLHSYAEYSGTGIGLAICKRIVDAHGGRIWLESAEDRGSTFYFSIPATELG